MRSSDWSSDVCSSDRRQLLKKITPPTAEFEAASAAQPEPCGGGQSATSEGAPTELDAEILSDFQYYITLADGDRRDLEQKLADAGRTYAVADAKRKKERFNMTLQRHIAQPSARSEEYTSELQSLMRISYAVFCLKKN